MLKRLFFLFFILVPISLCAQKKDISKARDYVKAGKELPKAEQMMRTLLKDSTNRGNEKIWLTLFDAVKAQYDKGNEQLYLGNKYDTATLFTTALEMFKILESFDSIDAKADENGRIKPKYRKRHAELLNTYRPNIYNGGLFFARKQDYQKAYNFFDAYLDCRRQPLFETFRYADTDTLLPRAAYMATYCGFKQGDVSKTLKYEELATTDTATLDNGLQYLSQTYISIGDTARYVSLLGDGFARYPSTLYYFSHLFDHYYKHGDTEKSLALCDAALTTDSTNSVFLLARSTVLLSIGRYDECISICDTLIASDSTLADAYLNAGLSYYNQATLIHRNTVEARKKRKQLLALYKQAMPYMQRYRTLRPDNDDVWGMPLYTIYLNLNMGKEFDEIDALLKTKYDGTK